MTRSHIVVSLDPKLFHLLAPVALLLRGRGPGDGPGNEVDGGAAMNTIPRDPAGSCDSGCGVT